MYPEIKTPRNPVISITIGKQRNIYLWEPCNVLPLPFAISEQYRATNISPTMAVNKNLQINMYLGNSIQYSVTTLNQFKPDIFHALLPDLWLEILRCTNRPLLIDLIPYGGQL